MDGIHKLLDAIRDHHLANGRIKGVFHICIGRRVESADGKVLSTGVTWRQLALLMKEAKFDKELARELGVDPDEASPRDREKMWYLAILAAGVDSQEARDQADELTVRLKPHGFIIGPPPTAVPRELPPPPKPSESSTGKKGRKK